MTRLAMLSLAAWALHATELIIRASPWDLLWTCNLAPLLVAAGCLAKRGQLVAVGLCWLIYGTPMWILDMALGGGVMLSSFASHLGVLVIGFIAVRRLGWPERSWLWAIAGATAVLGVTRLIAPPGPNVNLAFRVWTGWEDVFVRHDLYLLLMWAGGGLSFWVVERAYHRFAARPALGEVSSS